MDPQTHELGAFTERAIQSSKRKEPIIKSQTAGTGPAPRPYDFQGQCINGPWRHGGSDRAQKDTNPYTDETLAEFRFSERKRSRCEIRFEPSGTDETNEIVRSLYCECLKPPPLFGGEIGFYRYNSATRHARSVLLVFTSPVTTYFGDLLKGGAMKNRKLGRSGISIAPLVLGGNVFGWTADEPTSFAILDRFLDAGFNAIDTADSYSAFVPGNAGGESETIIGKWLKRRGRRDDAVIMTKVGMWARHEGLRAANIEAAAEDSLRRLQTNYIDVYFAHVDDQTVPLEETLGAFSRLIEAGKVRTIGASNYGAGRLREALDLAKVNSRPRYEVLQPQYNLYDRADFEGGLEKLALDNDLGVVSYFGLASGFLTGKYRSEQDLKGKARGRFVQRYFNDRGYRILRALDQVSAELSGNPAQVALAWLIGRPAVTAPIASATNVKQLNDTLGAARLQLSGNAIRLLDEASAY